MAILFSGDFHAGEAGELSVITKRNLIAQGLLSMANYTAETTVKKEDFMTVIITALWMIGMGIFIAVCV